jgi:hypothetical protein
MERPCSGLDRPAAGLRRVIRDRRETCREEELRDGRRGPGEGRVRDGAVGRNEVEKIMWEAQMKEGDGESERHPSGRCLGGHGSAH